MLTLHIRPGSAARLICGDSKAEAALGVPLLAFEAAPNEEVIAVRARRDVNHLLKARGIDHYEYIVIKRMAVL